ncbi:Retrotransposable element Tf2 protein [Rhizoctonia solani]|uniref:Retrotransposable element Tf2 protein n=1 Tax=Rhizoctonia solani TaxID=456999 RepID=A0A8H8SZS2_9AGAM|nr:Retrotransposable element Tf2 protein [Rhizoctonia solani]QRW23739.1 Retrotransposable element Tf2 protein [Rhizoctonia solani]
MERVNQFIKFYLRSYVAADYSDWSMWLPLAEYAYNNAKHAATGKTPFELVYGQNPVMNLSNVPANVPEADALADTLAQEWKEAKAALRMSKEKMIQNQGSTLEYSGYYPGSKSPSQPFPEQPPPETIEGEEEYKVEQIIDSKRQQGNQDEIKRFNQARLKKACDAAKSL